MKLIHRKKRSRLSSSENHTSAVSRLKSIKEKKQIIEKHNREIKTISKKEYFFKMHNIFDKYNVKEKINLTKEQYIKYINRINYEISILRNKIKNYRAEQNNKRIEFIEDSDNGESKIQYTDILYKKCDEVVEIENKLNELKEYKNILENKG
ncbi:hypothetical protein SLOPH_1021, partial [Spraguea lophii 42_110]